MLKKWYVVTCICVFWFAIGFVYVSAMVHSYWQGYGNINKPEVIPAGSLWTPANELPPGAPRGECVLPEVDMKGARELLPREVHNTAYAPSEPEELVSVDGLDITKHEAEIIKHTNDFRVRNGRKPLKVSRKLMGTARLQSWHMLRRRNMSHHLGPFRGAENIANGGDCVQMWINSSGHRANMLSNHNYIGVGSYGGYATQQFE